MGDPTMSADAEATLERAGLPAETIGAWLRALPAPAAALAGDYARDAADFARFWRIGADLLAKLPGKPSRSEAERDADALIRGAGRATRERFLARHVETVYRRLTDDFRRFVRVDDLAYEAAELLPGIAPTREAMRRESTLALKDKDGIEIDQGILIAHVLAHEAAGRHLCHAMLLPRPESAERLAAFLAGGTLALGAAALERLGKAVIVEMRHPRFLNAEDDTSLDDIELAVDLAILDPRSEAAVLRGGTVDHPRYRGKRVFSAGINLTHLYQGKIPYLWYLRRDMGVVNKIFRGLARRGALPDDIVGTTVEKPWIAAVDAFAIGGGCQYLLVMDYVVAARDAYMTLPARKEGIIPGAANLRLARFTGDRIARQAVMYGRRLDCDSPAGALICDEIAAPDAMDAAVAGVVDGFTNSGMVSAASNRRAFRIAQEPLDAFRSYMAVYAREQAYCHFSPALVANLERHWDARNRKG
ncbi:MAG TPA: enoyl-CoA hydratase/isomerase family protein [Stellaceae bacterium]|nr:enoyl-CoA hydratase/isomerase family protein [Stellaceae bacterium]